jgi:membrane protease YdiL (CAAX protease family)
MKQRALEIPSMFWVYGTLISVAMIFDYLTYHHPFGSWKVSHLPSFSMQIGGAIFVVVYIVLTSLATRIFKWANELEKVFRQILSPFSDLQIILLALLSGFAEEWFFRGVVLSHLGLMISSILFGLCHLIPAPRLWAWSVIGFLMGIVLGWTFQHTQSLWLVAGIHTGINGILLWKLNRSGHQRPALSSTQ